MFTGLEQIEIGNALRLTGKAEVATGWGHVCVQAMTPDKPGQTRLKAWPVVELTYRNPRTGEDYPPLQTELAMLAVTRVYEGLEPGEAITVIIAAVTEQLARYQEAFARLAPVDPSGN